jgi:hypothetical protein
VDAIGSSCDRPWAYLNCWPATAAPMTTSYTTIAMKLIQISPRQLICEDDTYRQHLITFSGAAVLGVITAISGVLSGFREMGLGIGTVMVLLGITICAGLPQYTATIDLDRQSIQIKQYWPLFRKRKIKQYPIAMIKRIEVNVDPDRSCLVQWQNQDGAVVMFGNRYTADRSRAEADAEIIRSFLNQDGRDIEITS